MQKERHDEIQFTTKMEGFLNFIPPYCIFLQVIFESNLMYDQT